MSNKNQFVSALSGSLSINTFWTNDQDCNFKQLLSLEPKMTLCFRNDWTERTKTSLNQRLKTKYYKKSVYQLGAILLSLLKTLTLIVLQMETFFQKGMKERKPML